MKVLKLAVIVFFVPLLLCGQITVDKKYHTGAGIVIGVWGTFAGNSIDLKPEGAALFGIGSVVVAGLGKELWDEIEYGGWDWKDFGYTMIGGVIGIGLSYAGLKIFDHDVEIYAGNLMSDLTQTSFPVIFNVGLRITI